MATTLRRSLILSTLLSIGSLTDAARLSGGGSSYGAPPPPGGLNSPPVGGGGNGYPSGGPPSSGPFGGFPQSDAGFGAGAPGGNGGGGSGGQFPPTPPIPETSFSCEEQDYPGYYADIEANCEIFHICQEDGRHDSFLCPNTTLFNQQYLVCDWPTNVDCAASADFFSVNAEIGKVPEGGSGGGGGNFGPSSDSGFGGYGGGSNGGGAGGAFANAPSTAYGPPGK